MQRFSVFITLEKVRKTNAGELPMNCTDKRNQPMEIIIKWWVKFRKKIINFIL